MSDVKAGKSTFNSDKYIVFERALQDLINYHSMENGSNTPDFIIARYLVQCLKAWDSASTQRAEWYFPVEKTGDAPSNSTAAASPFVPHFSWIGKLK